VIKFYFGSRHAMTPKPSWKVRMQPSSLPNRPANLRILSPCGTHMAPQCAIQMARFRRKRFQCPSSSWARVLCASYLTIPITVCIVLGFMRLCIRHLPPHYFAQTQITPECACAPVSDIKPRAIPLPLPYQAPAVSGRTNTAATGHHLCH